MKVFIINSFFSTGGPPRIVDGVIHQLQEQGDEFVLAAGREVPPPDIQTIRIGTRLNKYWHWLGSRLWDAQGFCSRKATKKLVDEIKAYQPDVIHLHNLHGYYLHVEVLFDYLKHAGIPVVWTLHDCWTMTGHCSHFDYIHCEKWKSGCFQCPQTGCYPICIGLDRSRLNYARKKSAFCGVPGLTLVSPSQWLCDIVSQSFLRDYPLRLIRNGIDLSRFSPAQSDLKERLGLVGKKVVLGVAQVWGERKGLTAFLRLSEKLPDEYQIVLVGMTSEQQQKLPRKIIGIGRTSTVSELTEYYSMADSFVNPTLEDTSPLTNLEALACGTPVITYATGGSPECISEGMGLVVPRDDLDGLCRGILLQRKTPEISRRCIVQAGNFDSKKTFAKYCSLFQEVKGNG